MTTTDELVLLAAIAADPGDDTVRLAYADWLQENDQPERAEFIRVQVAMHRGWYNPKCIHPEKKHYVNVVDGDTYPDACVDCWRVERARERELLTHADAWRTGVLAEKCQQCSGGYIPTDRDDNTCPACNGTSYLITIDRYERGCVAVVSMPLSALVRDAEKRVDAGECPRCEGGGHVLQDLSKRELVRHYTMNPPCPACHGTRRRTLGDGLAARLLREHPIVRGGIRLSDRVPAHDLDAAAYGWSRDRPTYQGPSREVLPPELYDALPPGNVYADADAAHEALAAAVYQWAYREAFGQT